MTNQKLQYFTTLIYVVKYHGSVLQFFPHFSLSEGIYSLQTDKGLEAFGCLQIWHSCTWSVHIEVHSPWSYGNDQPDWKHSSSFFYYIIYYNSHIGRYLISIYPTGPVLHLQVVEYVGEIVGLRVADKREIEYQSGRRLQYKSACYFFRIDKEHIIDATRKGGIARFVNHSCLVIESSPSMYFLPMQLLFL